MTVTMAYLLYNKCSTGFKTILDNCLFRYTLAYRYWTILVNRTHANV